VPKLEELVLTEEVNGVNLFILIQDHVALLVTPLALAQELEVMSALMQMI